MGTYRLFTGALAAALTLGIAGCQSTTAGEGSAELPLTAQSQPSPSDSGISGWPVPSGSGSASASGTPSGSPSPSPSEDSPSDSPSPSNSPSPSHHSDPPPKKKQQRAGQAPPQAAVAKLASKGYAPLPGSRTWYPRHTLNVVVGSTIGSPDEQFGLFFVNGRYIGRDTKLASAQIRLVTSSDRQVTLQYGIFAPGDAVCCPSAGKRNVRYLWNGQQLVPLDAIPPTDGTGRRAHS